MMGSWIGAARHSTSAALPSSTQLHSLAEMLASPSTSLAVNMASRVSRSAAIRVTMIKSLPPVALVAGPTASGKSALALALAKRSGGVIVNADASQIYRDLDVLSARPSAAEMAEAEHRLFGVRDGAEPCSAAEYAALARAEIAEVHASGRLPILVGGTGLYIRSLLDGIAPVPPIDPDIRRKVREASVAEQPRGIARGRSRRGGAAQCRRHDANCAGAGGGAVDRDGPWPNGRIGAKAGSARRSRFAR